MSIKNVIWNSSSELHVPELVYIFTLKFVQNGFNPSCTPCSSLIHLLLDSNLLYKSGHILLNCMSSLIGKETGYKNRGNMFHMHLVFIVQYVAFSEPILVKRFCQDFIKTS